MKRNYSTLVALCAFNICGCLKKVNFRSTIRFFIILPLLVLSLQSYSQGWEWKNPLPQGNVINCIWFTDANTGFHVGEYGTLMRTKNGGITWEHYNCNTYAHFNAVTFANDMVGYVGGTWGKLFKTTDGGNTWFQIPWGNNEDTFKSICFTSPDTGYVLSPVLFRTTDGGNSWSSVTDVGGDCIRFYDSQNGIITNSQSVFRTNDGGVTWEMQHIGYTLSGCAYVSSEIVLIGGSSMRRSVDGGITWELVPGAPTDIKSFFFVDELTGYAGGTEGRIYKTADAGLTWQLQTNADYESIQSIYFVGETGYAVGMKSALPVMHKTTNGGNYWQNTSSNITYESPSAIAFADENTVYWVGSSRIIKSIDQGNNWQVIDSTQGFNYAVDFPTSMTGYVGGYNYVKKTSDGGNTWQKIDIPFNLYINSIKFINETTGIAVGDGPIIRTTDGGNTWTSQFESYNVVVCNEVVFTDSLTGFAAGTVYLEEITGVILKTIDGGLTWTVTDEPYMLESIAFPTPDIGYAGGYDCLLKTTNGGQDWTIIEETGFLCTNSLCFINADTGYSAGHYGRVYKTIDGGLTWTRQWSKTGLEVYDIDFLDENIGFFTGLRGVILKTTDGGGIPIAVKDIPLMSVKLNVFPNPVTDLITVETIPNSILSIYTLTGKLLYCQKSEGVFTKLDLSGFPNGMYILRQQSERNIATSKVIKK